MLAGLTQIQRCFSRVFTNWEVCKAKSFVARSALRFDARWGVRDFGVIVNPRKKNMD